MGLTPCSHEEEDSRIFVHVADAVYKGHTKVAIHTVKTDVVVMQLLLLKSSVLESSG